MFEIHMHDAVRLAETELDREDDYLVYCGFYGFGGARVLPSYSELTFEALTELARELRDDIFWQEAYNCGMPEVIVERLRDQVFDARPECPTKSLDLSVNLAKAGVDHFVESDGLIGFGEGEEIHTYPVDIPDLDRRLAHARATFGSALRMYPPRVYGHGVVSLHFHREATQFVSKGPYVQIFTEHILDKGVKLPKNTELALSTGTDLDNIEMIGDEIRLWPM